MQHANRTFRIFVSSTFSDLKAERNALQTEVFGRLRQLCESHGCRFQAIDLRWGIGEEAANDQRTMEICLEEVSRCQKVTPRPNFIVLLGDRYGWCPLPVTIAASDFEVLRRQVPPADHALLCWDEGQPEDDKGWYRRDDNTLCDHSDAAPGEAVYRLRARTGRDTDHSEWEAVERRLHRILSAAVAATPGIPPDRRSRYTSSATEQEISKGVLAHGDPGHVFAFFRHFSNADKLAAAAPENPVAREFLDCDPDGRPDEGAAEKLRELKDALAHRLKENVHDRYTAAWTGRGVTTDHLGALCKDVHDSLARVIESEIAAMEAVSPVEQEALEHSAFAEELDRPDRFVGRADALGEIQRYLGDGCCLPLAVVGPSGVGKSTLLAHAARTTAQDGGRVVVSRFVGATPASSTARSLLEFVCEQIATAYDDPRPIPKDYAALVEALPERLARASPEQPLLVVIDGLNQLADDDGDPLTWLPLSLPPHVKLIVSAAPGPCLDRLSELLPAGQLQRLSGMCRREGEALLARWLADSRRTLQPAQSEAILRAFERNGLPLFLKLAFDQARRWRSHDPPEALAQDVAGLLEAFFKRLEDPANHGSLLVRLSLGFLSAARHGLSEDEILDLLSADDRLLDHLRHRSQHSPEISRLPVVIWSRLYAELEPYLAARTSGGTITISFHGDAVRQAAMDRYLSSLADATERHRELARHFQQQADPDGNQQWSGGLRRGFTELAYHYHRGARLADPPDRLYELARDARFRERQFEVTRRIEPVMECLRFAVERATALRDPVATVLLTLVQVGLGRSLAKTFVFQLVPLAQSDPEFALTIAETIPDQAGRAIASLLVAWVCHDEPAHQPLARHIIAQLGSGDTGVDAGYAAILIWIARDLLRTGMPEGIELSRLVPECPLRQVCRRVWAEAGGAEQQLANSFAGHQPATVSAEAWSRVMEIDRFTQAASFRGLLASNSEGFEEQAYLRFGPDGARVAWTCVAADALVNGHREEARLPLSRSLLIAQATDNQPWRLQMSLVGALMDHRESDLAREYRDRITSFMLGRMKHIQDKRLLWNIAPVVEDLAPLHDEAFLSHPSFFKARQQLKKLLAKESQPPESRIDTWLHQACRSAATGDREHAVEVLREVTATLGNDLATDTLAALQLSIAALRHALGSPDLKEATPDPGVAVLFGTPDAADGLPDDCCQLFDRALRGPASALAAVALALRLAGKSPTLYRFVHHAVERSAPPESIDAIIAQIPLLAATDASKLREIGAVLDTTDRKLGVSSGLGIYYFVAPWLFALVVGALLAGAGWVAQETRPAGAVALAGGLLGAVFDLWCWRRWKLWQRPERSRRLGLSTGTVLAIWCALMYLYMDPASRRWDPEMWPAFLTALTAAALAFPLTGFLLLRWGATPRRGYGLAGAVAALSAIAVPFSPMLATTFGPEIIAGVQLAGAVLLASGVNILLKFLRVRRYFHARGIRLDATDKSVRISKFRAPLREEQEHKLRSAMYQTDKLFRAHRYRAAERGYSAIIGNPDFASLPAERQEMVFVQRGLSRRNLGRHKDSIADQQKAAALRPEIPTPWLNMGLVLAQDLHRYREGRAAFSEVILRDPSNAEGFSCRGVTCQAMGDMEAAMSDLETAVQLDPHHPDAQSNLGGLLLQCGRITDALDAFRRSVEADPRDHINRFNYALALARSGDEAEARAVLRKDPKALRLWRQRMRAQRAP